MFANHPQMAERWAEHTPDNARLPEHVGDSKKRKKTRRVKKALCAAPAQGQSTAPVSPGPDESPPESLLVRYTRNDHQGVRARLRRRLTGAKSASTDGTVDAVQEAVIFAGFPPDGWLPKSASLNSAYRDVLPSSNHAPFVPQLATMAGQAAADSKKGTQPNRAKKSKPRVMVFLHGTAIMHPSGVGKTPAERIAQVESQESSVADYGNYVPVGDAAKKIEKWRQLGAQISYLSSHTDSAAVAQDASVLKRHGFPRGTIYYRGPEEQYSDVVARAMPDTLIEDDCESIGGTAEMTHPNLPPELRRRIKSIVVPEFTGIDHVQDLDAVKDNAKPSAVEDDRPYRERVEAFGLDPLRRVLGGYYEDDKTHGVFGGGIDPGETPEQAAAREFLEEAGHELKNPRLLPIDPHAIEWTPPYDTPDQERRAKHFRGSRTHFVAGDIGASREGAREPSWLTNIRLRTLGTAIKGTKPKQGLYPELVERRRKALRMLLKEHLGTKQANLAVSPLFQPANAVVEPTLPPTILDPTGTRPVPEEVARKLKSGKKVTDEMTGKPTQYGNSRTQLVGQPVDASKSASCFQKQNWPELEKLAKSEKPNKRKATKRKRRKPEEQEDTGLSPNTWGLLGGGAGASLPLTALIQDLVQHRALQKRLAGVPTFNSNELSARTQPGDVLATFENPGKMSLSDWLMAGGTWSTGSGLSHTGTVYHDDSRGLPATPRLIESGSQVAGTDFARLLEAKYPALAGATGLKDAIGFGTNDPLGYLFAHKLIADSLPGNESMWARYSKAHQLMKQVPEAFKAYKEWQKQLPGVGAALPPVKAEQRPALVLRGSGTPSDAALKGEAEKALWQPYGTTTAALSGLKRLFLPRLGRTSTDVSNTPDCDTATCTTGTARLLRGAGTPVTGGESPMPVDIATNEELKPVGLSLPKGQTKADVDAAMSSARNQRIMLGLLAAGALGAAGYGGARLATSMFKKPKKAKKMPKQADHAMPQRDEIETPVRPARSDQKKRKRNRSNAKRDKDVPSWARLLFGAGPLPWLALGGGAGAAGLARSIGTEQQVQDAVEGFKRMQEPLKPNMTMLTQYADSMNAATNLRLLGIPMEELFPVARSKPWIMGREPIINLAAMGGDPAKHQQWIEEQKKLGLQPFAGQPGEAAPKGQFNTTPNPKWYGPRLAQLADKLGLTKLLMRGVNIPGYVADTPELMHGARAHYRAFRQGPVAAVSHMMRGPRAAYNIEDQTLTGGKPTSYHEYFTPKFEKFIRSRSKDSLLPNEFDLQYMPREEQTKLLQEFHASLTPAEQAEKTRIETGQMANLKSENTKNYQPAIDAAQALHKALGTVGATAGGAGLGGLIGHGLYKGLTPRKKRGPWRSRMATLAGMGLGGAAGYFGGTTAGRTAVADLLAKVTGHAKTSGDKTMIAQAAYPELEKIANPILMAAMRNLGRAASSTSRYAGPRIGPAIHSTGKALLPGAGVLALGGLGYGGYRAGQAADKLTSDIGDATQRGTQAIEDVASKVQGVVNDFTKEPGGAYGYDPVTQLRVNIDDPTYQAYLANGVSALPPGQQNLQDITARRSVKDDTTSFLRNAEATSRHARIGAQRVNEGLSWLGQHKWPLLAIPAGIGGVWALSKLMQSRKKRDEDEEEERQTLSRLTGRAKQSSAQLHWPELERVTTLEAQ